MSLPQFMFKELSLGSGSIIGRENIKDFFDHISKHDNIEDKSIVDLAPNYEIAAASLVHLLDARFASLNPITQQMFLNLNNTEDAEKKDFVLETLVNEFGSIALEARKVFDRYRMLGSCVDVISVLEKLDKIKNREDDKVAIPSKLVALHEAYEKNFDWIVLENPFDESSQPKRVERGDSETFIDKIQCIVEKTSAIDLNAPPPGYT